MSQVIQVPTIWDYIGQGVDRGFQEYRGAQERDRQKKMEEFSIIAQMFNQGAVDSDRVNTAGKAVGLDLGVNANPAEMRRRIAASKEQMTPIPGVGGMIVPTGGMDSFSDEDRAFAGLPTRLDQQKQALERTTLGLQQQFAGGQRITPQQAAAIGMKTPGSIEAAERKDVDSVTGDLATRYVGNTINQFGGRLHPSALAGVAESAYNKYLEDRQKTGLGNMSPEEAQYAQSFFGQAVQQAFMEQQRMDIEGRKADAYVNQTNNRTDETRWFRAITTRVNGLNKRQTDLINSNPGLQYALDKPELANNPIFSRQVAEYKQNELMLQQLQEAQRTGIVSADLAALLGEPTDGSAPMGQGGRGSGSAPADGVGVSAPPMDDATKSQAVRFLRGMKSSERGAYIDEKIKSGRISVEDAVELKKLSGA